MTISGSNKSYDSRTYDSKDLDNLNRLKDGKNLLAVKVNTTKGSVWPSLILSQVNPLAQETKAQDKERSYAPQCP